MIKSKIFITLFILLNFFAEAEDDAPKPRLWYVNPGFGISVPFTRVSIGKETDYLINYSNFNYHFKMKGNFFLFNNLGMYASVIIAQPSNYKENSADLMAILEQKYATKYFIIDGEESDIYANSLNVEGYFGLTYRIKMGVRFEILPSIMLGYNSIETTKKNYFLKEKGTNSVYNLKYSSSNNFQEQVLFSTSVSSVYKLNNRLKLNLDLQYSFFRIDFGYNKLVQNQLSQEIISSENFEYKKSIHKFSPGIGIIVEL